MPTTAMQMSIIPKTLLKTLRPLGLNLARILLTSVDIKNHHNTAPAPIDKIPITLSDASSGVIKLKRANIAIKKNNIPIFDKLIKNEDTIFCQ